MKVVEGERTRVQNFEGVCIARANKGIGSSFTVRKISFGEGVERVFPLYSPNVDSIEVVRRGAVRRAKLYYLRGRTGKSARIAERRDTAPRPPAPRAPAAAHRDTGERNRRGLSSRFRRKKEAGRAMLSPPFLLARAASRVRRHAQSSPGSHDPHRLRHHPLVPPPPAT